MKLQYKNAGVYPAYTLSGTELTLAERLTLDLATLAQDEPVHLIVSADREGNLALGFGWRYVAELDLPAKPFRMEKIGYTDDFGYPALRKAYLPYPAEDAVLTLWAEKEGN